MKNLLYITFVFVACSTSGQKSAQSKDYLPKDEVIKKYLEDGAWRVRYFSTEYQNYIDSAIVANPTIAYLYQQKAMPYFKLGKYEVGLRSLDKAVELDPQSHIDYRAFIKCIFAKTYEEAIKDFLKSKQIKGENGYVMDHSYNFYLGLCYLQLNDLSKAQNYLEQSMELTRKTNGEKWIHFLDQFYGGIVAQESGNHLKAIEYFDKAIATYSRFSDAKYYKAISLFKLGDTEYANAMLAECENDFNAGYTINEDNATYEKYPYQLKRFYIDMLKATKG
jgi:tetratricopeptide (TPR) repeat protein